MKEIPPEISLEARKLREKEFHDAVYSAEPQGSKLRRIIYSVTGSADEEFMRSILNVCRGKRVLEYGCGSGARALTFAAAGARVTGIDISEEAVRLSREHAAQKNVDAGFRTMDAEDLDLPDNSFDIVCGTGILHHLDLGRAYSEIARVLRPGGIAFFLEPMALHPLVRIFRGMTPAIRTADEHPLTVRDLDAARETFGAVSYRYYFLTTPLSLVLFPLGLHKWTAGALDRIDIRLFSKLPGLRKYAWYVFLNLAKNR